jgi:hypothetical protein
MMEITNGDWQSLAHRGTMGEAPPIGGGTKGQLNESSIFQPRSRATVDTQRDVDSGQQPSNGLESDKEGVHDRHAAEIRVRVATGIFALRIAKARSIDRLVLAES